METKRTENIYEQNNMKNLRKKSQLTRGKSLS